jgi:hypothetical protein
VNSVTDWVSKEKAVIDNIGCVLRKTSPYCEVVLWTLSQKHLLLSLFNVKESRLEPNLTTDLIKLRLTFCNIHENR